MSIRVEIPTILRSYTGGANSVLADGVSLANLVSDLDDKHPGIAGRLIEGEDQDRRLRRFVNVYRNDEDVRFLGGLQTSLEDGDTITILPAVAGGAVGQASLVFRFGTPR